MLTVSLSWVQMWFRQIIHSSEYCSPGTTIEKKNKFIVALPNKNTTKRSSCCGQLTAKIASVIYLLLVTQQSLKSAK